MGLSAPHSSLGEEALLERWLARLPKDSDTGSMHLTGSVRCTRLNNVPECTAPVPECTGRVPESTAAFRATPRDLPAFARTTSRAEFVVVSAFRRTREVRLKRDTTYVHMNVALMRFL